MSTASDILARLKAFDGAAVTLRHGYAMRPCARILFEPCRVIDFRQNKQGRCTYLIGEYEDGSHIRFRWSLKNGGINDIPPADDPALVARLNFLNSKKSLEQSA